MKEMGVDNQTTPRHDGVGNYNDQNGIRYYSVTYAMHDGDSTTRGSSTAPRGSVLQTTHTNGRDYIFKAGVSIWEAIGGSGADTGSVAAVATIDFSDVAEDGIAVDNTVTAGGIAFTYKTAPSGVVQVQLATEDDISNRNDTVLGINLFNMAAKLNASVNGAVTPATYSTDATDGHKNAEKLYATVDTPGFAGNAFTFTTNVEDADAGVGTAVGGVDAKAGFDTYRANLTQVTTGTPTASIQLNELGGAAPALARTSAGIYTLIKAGAFPVGRTFCKGGILQADATHLVSWFATLTDADTITIKVMEQIPAAANTVTWAAKELSGVTPALLPIEIFVKHA